MKLSISGQPKQIDSFLEMSFTQITTSLKYNWGEITGSLPVVSGRRGKNLSRSEYIFLEDRTVFMVFSI